MNEWKQKSNFVKRSPMSDSQSEPIYNKIIVIKIKINIYFNKKLC